MFTCHLGKIILFENEIKKYSADVRIKARMKKENNGNGMSR